MKKIVGLFVFGVAAFVAGWVASNHYNAVEEDDDFDLDEIDDVDDADTNDADTTDADTADIDTANADVEVKTNKETEDEQ